jgi:hypothetical protein
MIPKLSGILARAIERPVPFLSYPHVSDDLWQELKPGQRDLHLLWTKKFVPLFDDADRVRDEDLAAGDRQRIKALLRRIASRRLAFHGPETFHTAAGAAAFLHGHADLCEERLTLEVIALTSPQEAPPAERISIHAHGARTEIDIVILWRPQDDPRRGSVLLYPQAAHSRRRFGIAAFNRAQFAALSAAFIEYCAGCGKSNKHQATSNK